MKVASKAALLFVSLCIVFTCSLTFPNLAYGDDGALASTSPSQIEATFDLAGPAAQEQEVILENGDTAIIGIERIPSAADDAGVMPLWDSYYPNATGTWRIYYNSPIIYRQYYISISSSHNITSAWGEAYQSFGCSITGERLTRSSKMASYRLNWVSVAGVASGVAFLDASIEGTTLHTYAN